VNERGMLTRVTDDPGRLEVAVSHVREQGQRHALTVGHVGERTHRLLRAISSAEGRGRKSQDIRWFRREAEEADRLPGVARCQRVDEVRAMIRTNSTSQVKSPDVHN
jgi:hypothetical protein